MAILAAVGLGIAVSVGAFNKENQEVKKTNEDISDLASTIYKLSEKSEKINNVLNKFEQLDNKVIKTTEDLKEMDNLFSSIADALSEGEKKEYQLLETDAARLKMLEDINKQAKLSTEQARETQRNTILNTSAKTIAGSAINLDSLHSLNRNTLYDTIDNSKDDLKLTTSAITTTRELVESMLNQMSVEQHLKMLRDDNNRELQEYVNKMGKLALQLEDTNLSLGDKVKLYQAALDSLTSDEAKTAFKQANRQ